MKKPSTTIVEGFYYAKKDVWKWKNGTQESTANSRQL